MAFAVASNAFTQSKTLYVGMNGGNFEKTFTQAVFPDFEKANDVKVVVVTAFEIGEEVATEIEPLATNWMTDSRQG